MGAALGKMGVLKKKKNKKIGDSMLMILPEEVLTKILLTLPIKSLMLLKCVSKSLNTFLRTPYFIDLHMKQQPECILISSRCRSFLSFHSYESLNEISPHFEIPYFDSNEFKVSWPCNGLLVCAATGNSTTVLCNLATREIKLLPSSPFHGPEWKVITVGLGFDSQKHEYKVVITLKNSNSNYKTELYNLSSNSWRQIDHEIPLFYVIGHHAGGVPFNGALHWIARRESFDIILSFDVSNEVFKDRDLPKPISKPDDMIKLPTIINDSLALFAFRNFFFHPNGMEIWVMEEGSWAKRVTGINFARKYIYPGLLWKNEAILMSISDTKLKVYNLDTQRISDTGIKFRSYMELSVMVYKESLVSIK